MSLEILHRRRVQQVYETAEIVSDSLIYYVDSETPASYSGGSTWTDLIEGRQGAMANVGGDPLNNTVDKSVKFDAENELITFEIADYINIPANTDVTFCAFLRVNSWESTGNPGFWRNNLGNSFNIFDGQTGFPWVRINGANILRPSTGYAVPLGQFVYVAFVMKNAEYVKFYSDAVERHSVNHSISLPASEIRKLNMQSTGSENIRADYKSIQMYYKALSPEEITQNYNALKAHYGYE